MAQNKHSQKECHRKRKERYQYIRSFQKTEIDDAKKKKDNKRKNDPNKLFVKKMVLAGKRIHGHEPGAQERYRRGKKHPINRKESQVSHRSNQRRTEYFCSTKK